MHSPYLKHQTIKLDGKYLNITRYEDTDAETPSEAYCMTFKVTVLSANVGAEVSASFGVSVDSEEERDRIFMGIYNEDPAELEKAKGVLDALYAQLAEITS